MTGINGIKLFAMNDSETFAAATEAEAVECMRETYNCASLDQLRADYLQDGPVTELAEESLDQLKITIEDDGPEENESRTLTFREHLQEMIDSGVEFPSFFSSTEC